MFSIEVLSCCDFKLTEDAGVFNVKAEKSFCVIQTFTVTPEHCEAHKSKCIYLSKTTFPLPSLFVLWLVAQKEDF